MLGEWLLTQQGSGLYLIVFLLLLGGAFFLPIPEDLVLISVGVLIYNDMADPRLLLLIAYLTIILGDIILYFIGFMFGMNLFKQRWFRNRIHPTKIKKVREHLNSNHITAIFLGRHLFYLRSLTFVTCGAVKMRFVKYLTADMIAACISCAIMVTIGYFASENYEKYRKNLENTQIILLIVVGSVAVWWAVKRMNKKAE